MSKLRSFIIFWAPVLIWMVLIFTGSGDQGSFKHSSRIIEPLLRWLFPGMSSETIFDVVLTVRKCCHLGEYAVLALLVWRARRKPKFRDLRPWSWVEAIEGLWATVLYATTDEFHQTFVPSREGCLRDVIIDSTGAVIGLLLLRLVGRRLKLWTKSGGQTTVPPRRTVKQRT